MRNETPVTVVGTLVKSAEPRRVGEDQAQVLKLRIASNERRYDRAEQRWVDGDSLYLSVNCWRQLAENAASLVKGDPVIVSGRLRTHEWTTEHGERRSVVELEASAIGPDLARCTVTAVRRPRREEYPATAVDGADDPGPDGADDPGPGGAGDGGGELGDAARPLVGATV